MNILFLSFEISKTSDSHVNLFECKGSWMLKSAVNCLVWNRILQNYTEKVPCTVLLNYLHTFAFKIFSVFNTLYLHN